MVDADRWIDRFDEKLNLWATQPFIRRWRDELAMICEACHSGAMRRARTDMLF
jgi:hypothetical protein